MSHHCADTAGGHVGIVELGPRDSVPDTEQFWPLTQPAQHQVQRGLHLDIVARQREVVLDLLARKDEALLLGRDALLVINLGLDMLDGVAALALEDDRLARERLDEYATPTTGPRQCLPRHHVQRGLRLDIVARQRAAVL